MKFLVPNYSCLQNPWLGDYLPQIPVLSVLSPQLNLLTPPPRTKFQSTPLLRSFLGLVNYYQSSVPNMHSIRQPLDELLKKDNEWIWSARCQQASESIKGILNSDLLLTHYDTSLEVVVAADASEHHHTTPVARWLSHGHCSCFVFTETGRTELQPDWEGWPGTNFRRKEIPQVYLRTAFHASCGSSTSFVDIWKPQGYPSLFSQSPTTQGSKPSWLWLKDRV